MYSSNKAVQILVSLLKQYDVSNVVLAPGGSDVPLIHSLEVDPFFKCHSVVDERSLVYFAMGISQQTGMPVACICTSGTAVSNFLPGTTEAFYQDVPLIMITADKNPRYEGQLETQKINQADILETVTRKVVKLPIIQSEEDYQYAIRLADEAFARALKAARGPVHINVPLISDLNNFDEPSIPTVKKLEFVSADSDDCVWRNYAEEIKVASRILIVAGQQVGMDDDTIAEINEFCSRFNCAVSVEHLSNFDSQYSVHTYPITETMGSSLPNELIPDLVISFGNNIASYGLKPVLRQNSKKIRHFSIDYNGRVRDTFNALTAVFECRIKTFFSKILAYAQNDSNDLKYLKSWIAFYERVGAINPPYSNFLAGKLLSEFIPANSVLHLSVLNSIRMMEFFDLDESITVYGNIGALGIDGCLSSFIGQATATNNLAYCLIGDLSFFYDMNAVGINDIRNNVRIVLINNGGGAEFHYFVGRDTVATLDENICASHGKSAKGWVESLGFRYLRATCEAELREHLEEMAQESDCPIFLEVITDAESDGALVRELYAEAAPKTMKSSVRNLAKSKLTTKQIGQIRKIFKV